MKTPTGKSVEEEQRREAFLSPSLDSKTRGVSANEGTLKLFQNHGSVIIGGGDVRVVRPCIFCLLPPTGFERPPTSPRLGRFSFSIRFRTCEVRNNPEFERSHTERAREIL